MGLRNVPVTTCVVLPFDFLIIPKLFTIFPYDK